MAYSPQRLGAQDQFPLSTRVPYTPFVYARMLAYVHGKLSVDTYLRRYIRVHLQDTYPYLTSLAALQSSSSCRRSLRQQARAYQWHCSANATVHRRDHSLIWQDCESSSLSAASFQSSNCSQKRHTCGVAGCERADSQRYGAKKLESPANRGSISCTAKTVLLR